MFLFRMALLPLIFLLMIRGESLMVHHHFLLFLLNNISVIFTAVVWLANVFESVLM